MFVKKQFAIMIVPRRAASDGRRKAGGDKASCRSSLNDDLPNECTTARDLSMLSTRGILLLYTLCYIYTNYKGINFVT